MSNGTLHILNKGPSQKELFELCSTALGVSDHLILIEDAVYWAMENFSDTLSSLPCSVSVLEADALARGITVSSCSISNDLDFVERSAAHARSVSWF